MLAQHCWVGAPIAAFRQSHDCTVSICSTLTICPETYIQISVVGVSFTHASCQVSKLQQVTVPFMEVRLLTC